jgi:hypothetical protein
VDVTPGEAKIGQFAVGQSVQLVDRAVVTLPGGNTAFENFKHVKSPFNPFKSFTSQGVIYVRRTKLPMQNLHGYNSTLLFNYLQSINEQYLSTIAPILGFRGI